MAQLRRIRAAAALTLTALAIAACAGGPRERDRPAGPTATPTASPKPRSAAAPTSTAPPRPDVPYTMADFGAVCDGTGYIGVTAYPGAAPHYVYLAGALPDIPEWQTETIHLVQLVACPQQSTGKPVKTCPYSGSGGTPITRTVVEGVVTITLRAARTGNVVATNRLVGADTDKCPPLLYQQNADHTVPTELTDDQVRKALAQYITG